MRKVTIFLAGMGMLALCAMIGGCAMQPDMRSAGSNAGHLADMTDRSQLDRAIALIADGQYSQSAAILGPVMARLRAVNDTVLAPEAGFWLGFSYEKMRQTPSAMTVFRQVVAEYPLSDFAVKARARLDSLSQP